MHLRTTVLLFLLVAALGALILGVERYLPSTRELREMKRGQVKFNRGDVTQFEIDSSGGDGVSMALEGNTWWVRRPFNDHAEPERVAKLFDELMAIGWVERVHRSEFDDSGWSKTGLDQPRHKLRVMAGNTCVLNVWLGSASPLEGSHYIGLHPTDKSAEIAYYVAKTALPDLLKPSPKDWRDNKLVRMPAEQVESVTLAQESGQIEMVRVSKELGWILTKPLTTRGSSEKINELISTLLNLEIKDAVESPNSSATGLESSVGSADISAQTLKVSLHSSDKTLPPIEITLTKPQSDAVETKATISNRKAVFTVVSKSLKELWAQPNDLRDKMLARLNEEVIKGIRIESLAFAPVVLEKKSDSWFLLRHKRLDPANGDRVSSLFEALNTHQVRNYTSDSAANLAAYGLDKPFLTVSWTYVTDQKAKLLFGVNAERTEFFAKYDSEPSVYQIDASLLPSIPQDGIKWKGLGVLRFTQFALRKIELSIGANPPTLLNYDPTTAQWTGMRAERDITAKIDRVKADRFAGILARLNVLDWSADASDAVKALKEPALRIVVTLGEPGTNTGPTKDTVLNFAPTQAGMDTVMYYGQVGQGPDVFYISRSSLLELLVSVFKEE